jgi:hypothetical protein
MLNYEYLGVFIYQSECKTQYNDELKTKNQH